MLGRGSALSALERPGPGTVFRGHTDCRSLLSLPREGIIFLLLMDVFPCVFCVAGAAPGPGTRAVDKSDGCARSEKRTSSRRIETLQKPHEEDVGPGAR